jgi:hypothetical protein
MKQFATGVIDTGGKFAAGVVDTVGNFPPASMAPANLPWVSLIPAAILSPVSLTLTCEYLCEFSKKFEMTLMLFSGAWGKVIHEKT